MSSEHDWLIEDPSDSRFGLGIMEGGDLYSTELPKVRMAVYSQYYYSLLDTLCLCMFCYAPWGLFNYRHIEDLVRCTTGWQCTFWELMKVGERRVNMMRQVNARRGFTREDDKLPDKLREPLPDGPTEGRRVHPEVLAKMLDQYYGLMGWDKETGNPKEEKLLELGLEWTM